MTDAPRTLIDHSKIVILTIFDLTLIKNTVYSQYEKNGALEKSFFDR